MSSTLMMGTASALSWGVNLVVSLALIAVCATIVRKHRPDAAPILLGALIFDLLVSIGAYALSIALSRLVGSTEYMDALALNTAVSGIAHAGARTLLLWGIIRLALPQPA